MSIEDAWAQQVNPASGVKGSYVLVIRLLEETPLEVGKLGTVTLQPGCYLYFGSALNGLRARVARHLRREKKLHWHIDFLTTKVPVTNVWWSEGLERQECVWAQTAQGLADVGVPAPGFGSSDCRCVSHLVCVATVEEATSLGTVLIPAPVMGTCAEFEALPSPAQ